MSDLLEKIEARKKAAQERNSSIAKTQNSRKAEIQSVGMPTQWPPAVGTYFENLPLNQIVVLPQIREKVRNTESLEEAIKEKGRIETPVSVYAHPDYPDQVVLLKGGRRFVASEKVKASGIRAIVEESPEDEYEKLCSQSRENRNREDLTIYENVLACQQAKKLKPKLSTRKLAIDLGIPASDFSQYMAVTHHAKSIELARLEVTSDRKIFPLLKQLASISMETYENFADKAIAGAKVSREIIEGLIEAETIAKEEFADESQKGDVNEAKQKIMLKVEKGFKSAFKSADKLTILSEDGSEVSIDPASLEIEVVIENNERHVRLKLS